MKISAFAFLLSALVASAPANSATFSILGTVENGPYAGTSGSGTVAYEDTLVSGIGFEQLIGLDIQLSFTILGQTFAETEDVAYPLFPLLDFFDGVPTFLDFAVVENAPDQGLSTEIFAPRVSEIRFISPLSQGLATGTYMGSAEVIGAIPVPAGLPLALSGLLALGLLRRFGKAP